MAKPGNNLRIPLPEKEALSLLLKVKPTADMPRHTQATEKRKEAERPRR